MEVLPMFKPGDVSVQTLEDYLEMYGPLDEGEEPANYDARGPRIKVPYVQLPHSCDGWIVGGVDEVRAMIGELQAALRKLEQVKG